MLYTLLVLAIYTVLVLLFVPLDKIGKYQLKLKAWVDQLKK